MVAPKSLLAVAAATTMVSAKTIVVTTKGTTAFEPQSIKAEKGDTIEWHFLPKNHSIVQSDTDADKACLPLKGGFFSGFNYGTENGEAGNVFRLLINNTDPIIYYCSQGKTATTGHCQLGMVGIINAKDNDTIKEYAAAAKKVQELVSPTGPAVGGLVVPNNRTSSDGSSSSGSGASTTAAPTASSGGSSGSAASSSAGASSTSKGGAVAGTAGQMTGVVGLLAGAAALLL